MHDDSKLPVNFIDVIDQSIMIMYFSKPCTRLVFTEIYLYILYEQVNLLEQEECCQPDPPSSYDIGVDRAGTMLVD